MRSVNHFVVIHLLIYFPKSYVHKEVIEIFFLILFLRRRDRIYGCVRVRTYVPARARACVCMCLRACVCVFLYVRLTTATITGILYHT